MNEIAFLLAGVLIGLALRGRNVVGLGHNRVNVDRMPMGKPGDTLVPSSHHVPLREQLRGDYPDVGPPPRKPHNIL